MKTRLKIAFVILQLFVFSSIVKAQPPDPPGDPAAGGDPIGGGAPLGSGTGVVLLMLSVYGAAKWRACLQTKDEPEQNETD
ncbi:MAG: hypothetical protein Q8S18_01255 [Bacteroidales bacterium]|nr:hypothetical protein [Bacteroidales bacterium]